jgi:hypothetical protein
MDMIESREQVAVAVNARVGSADSVGALDVQIGALARVDPLGALMVRLKYGRERRTSSFKQAVFLLARRERASSHFKGESAKWKAESRGGHRGRSGPMLPDIIERFAKAVLVEWVDDRCESCHGRGRCGASVTRVLEVEECKRCSGRGMVTSGFERRPFCPWPHGLARSAALPRNFVALPSTELVTDMLTIKIQDTCPACKGFRKVQRPAVRQAARCCEVCGGSGKKRFTAVHRSRAIGVSVVQYEALWHGRYDAALRMLNALDEWTALRLSVQTGRKELA